jgi:hypothetical protein
LEITEQTVPPTDVDKSAFSSRDNGKRRSPFRDNARRLFRLNYLGEATGTTQDAGGRWAAGRAQTAETSGGFVGSDFRKIQINEHVDTQNGDQLYRCWKIKQQIGWVLLPTTLATGTFQKSNHFAFMIDALLDFRLVHLS